jgi:hypothetical protein
MSEAVALARGVTGSKAATENVVAPEVIAP